MASLYATLTFVLCLAVAAVIVWSDRNPGRAIWPPREFGAPDRIATWAVTVVAIGAAWLAGRESWNAWGLPDWFRLGVGLPLAFAGSWMSSFAILKLGLDRSMGDKGGLVTDGLFARSRNPTYAANLALCAGWALLAASTPALVAAASLAALYVFAVPFEERWLARTYPGAWPAYREKVRRWF